jgi:hypothetical protein
VDKAMPGFVRQHGSREGKKLPKALSHDAGKCNDEAAVNTNVRHGFIGNLSV